MKHSVVSQYLVERRVYNTIQIQESFNSAVAYFRSNLTDRADHSTKITLFEEKAIRSKFMSLT